MRLRFLKTKEYSGIRTAVVNGVISVSDCRFFVEFGQILDIQSANIVNGSDADIILYDNSIYRIPLNEIEFSDPSFFKPLDKCCQDKK